MELVLKKEKQVTEVEETLLTGSTLYCGTTNYCIYLDDKLFKGLGANKPLTIPLKKSCKLLITREYSIRYCFQDPFPDKETNKLLLELHTQGCHVPFQETRIPIEFFCLREKGKYGYTLDIIKRQDSGYYQVIFDKTLPLFSMTFNARTGVITNLEYQGEMNIKRKFESTISWQESYQAWLETNKKK